MVLDIEISFFFSLNLVSAEAKKTLREIRGSTVIQDEPEAKAPSFSVTRDHMTSGRPSPSNSLRLNTHLSKLFGEAFISATRILRILP